MNDLQISVMIDRLKMINDTLVRIEQRLSPDNKSPTPDFTIPNKPSGPSYLKRERS